jgi:predicted outer membrane lipoprotein
MEFLLGKTGLLAAAATAIITGLIWLTHTMKKAGRDAYKAKELDAYEKHINDIARSAAARPRGGVSDDPYNRDNRK